ncbi:MAG: LemA family protein [Alphaproteobacteria bacterium]|nr:LemA family protein [Alphaproteobacteria bacterium]OJV15736.1 MAG: hypothetical protein BGO27_07460 [Alphaproteobacteria bacterium 33-17]
MDIEIIGYISAGLALLIYIWYVILVKRRNTTLNALSGIDVQLKRRHDLIPNLVAIASKTMEFEQKILTDITSIRAEAIQKYNQKDANDVTKHFRIEKELAGKLSNFIVNAENYPSIKSDTAMLEIQSSLQDIEENLSAARRFYNSAIMEFNNAVEIFPGNLIAKLFGFKSMPFFETENKDNLDINNILKK